MKLSENWLREWVNPPINTEQLAHQLTMAGLEVDGIESVAPNLDNIVVGLVVTIDAHPNADKLKICKVNVGTDKMLQIVCGAANVTVDGLFPVALIGAKLPSGLSIRKSMLRDIESEGMLCSAKELQLEDKSDGLMVLSKDAKPGTAIVDYLDLKDQCIEVSLTPNRGDCLSIAGIARELGVLNQIDVTAPKEIHQEVNVNDQMTVRIDAGSECPRYVGRIIKNVNPNLETPVWMKEKLRRSGVRSVNPIVDITNFVMLEMGQPMHAFDLDKIKNGIQVRLGKCGETIQLLDGQKLKLDIDTLIIADDGRPLAVAGIMGGEDSAVTDATKNIFLESAFFDSLHIASRARHYGLHTDSSHRFERGVDPNLQHGAMLRASALLDEIVGGDFGPITDIKTPQYQVNQVPILLKAAKIKRVLGIEIKNSTIENILTRLGMQVKKQGKDSWSIKVPSYRFDISLPIDLVEEIARIYGYSNFPNVAPTATTVMQHHSEKTIPLIAIKQTLVNRGYREAICYSFVDPSLHTLIDPTIQPVKLANPISAEMSVMRSTLWVGLINAAIYNINRQQNRIRLFEVGLSFVPKGDQLLQENMIAGVVSGTHVLEQWGEKPRDVDFFDLKSDVEALINYSRKSSEVRFVAATHSTLHPGQSADIVVSSNDGQRDIIGKIGKLHPAIQEKLGLTQEIYLFELKMSAINSHAIPRFGEISKFPTIRRDLAIIVDINIDSQEVSDCIKNNSPPNLVDINLFDVYTGQGIDIKKKSLAFSLTLQNIERTLTDNEVDNVISDIMSILNKELGATLRN